MHSAPAGQINRSLSSRDAEFLERQRIDPRWLYHRRGRERLGTALAAMRASDKWVLIGFTACVACKISLRSRKGNCLGCSKQLEHVRRYTERGTVYILFSPSTRLIKVGSTLKDSCERPYQLNAIGYGGACDWTVSYSRVVHRCGLFEDWLKAAMADYCEYVAYERCGTPTYARETYRCSQARAKRMFAESLALYSVMHGNGS
jgi:hypothetical protein